MRALIFLCALVSATCAFEWEKINPLLPLNPALAFAGDEQGNVLMVLQGV
jgi:hypothetical protein